MKTIAETLEGCDVGKVIRKEWGREIILANHSLYCAKHLIVEPGWQCSLHRHLKKHETFYVLSGRGWIFLAGRPHRLIPGGVVMIPTGEWHSVWNDGADALMLLEISTHHSDDDVQREVPSARIEALPRVPSIMP